MIGSASPEELKKLSDEELLALTSEALQFVKDDRKEWQLLYYKPASANALKIHLTTAHLVGIGGGNRSGKTDTNLAEAAIQATGIIPHSLKDIYPREKLRGPITVRVVCESHTTTLAPVILHKLNYQNWNGVDVQGGERGHWGWIPKACLIGEDWGKSWKESKRQLTVLCRDPDDPTIVLGESVFQFMCVRGDQRVLMADGLWKPIEQIEEGEEVFNPDGKPSRVSKVHEYQDASLMTIKCRGGRRIVATPNHQHYLADGSLKQTSELCVGDVLETFHYLPTQTRIFDAALTDWQLGWLGILLGDGYIKGRQAEFTAVEPSRVLANLPPLPPGCGLNKANNAGRWRVTLLQSRRDNPLVTWIKELGLWGLGSKEKFIPSVMFSQPPRAVAFFLKHLWNCDGTITIDKRQAMYVSISRQLAYDVKYLLWGLGIDAAITECDGRCGFTGKTVHRYSVQIYGGFFDRFLAMITGSDFEDIQGRTKGGCGTIYAIEEAQPETVYCLTVENERHAFIVDGLVTHNSHDQEPAKFASGEFHLVIMDEPPKYAIYRENRARIMSVGGRMLLGMTWPDDPTIPVDWIFDELYDIGQPGPKKHPDVEWIELVTTDNPNIDQDSVAREAAAMSEMERACRIGGKPIRFSNLVHPLFTNGDSWWCFRCNQEVLMTNDCCATCLSSEITRYNHVEDFAIESRWPTVFLLDPHPRKPHMFLYVQVDGNDDYSVVYAGELGDEPLALKKLCDEIEQEHSLLIAKRLIDPNMGASPASSRRGITWQDEFAGAGLYCDLANDSDVGRGRIDEYLKPDRRTYRPRIRFHEQYCPAAIYQMKRFVWDDFKFKDNRDQKQTPKPKYDDYPALLRYLMNELPLYSMLKHGGTVIRPQGAMRGGY